MKYWAFRAGQIIDIQDIPEQGIKFVTIATDPENIYTATRLIASDKTLVMDSNHEEITLDDLKVGDDVFVYHSMAMTMSIPPQTQAFVIEVRN